MKKILSIAIFFVLIITTASFADTYNLDIEHSSIRFKIRHLFAKTEGTFKDWTATAQVNPEDWSTFNIEGTVQATSIDTANEQRDKHLRSKDFFEVETYPTITFQSTEIRDIQGANFKVAGMLNLHGIEKEVIWDIEYHGAGPDSWGNFKNGFTATTTINRKDFDMVWNKTVDQGGVVLGDEVDVTVEFEGNKA